MVLRIDTTEMLVNGISKTYKQCNSERVVRRKKEMSIKWNSRFICELPFNIFYGHAYPCGVSSGSPGDYDARPCVYLIIWFMMLRLLCTYINVTK